MSDFFESAPSEFSAPAPVPADTSAQSAPNTTEAQPAESTPKEAQPDAAAEARKAFKGVQKRIDELTRQRYEAEERGKREADHWRAQAEQLHAQMQEAQRNKPLPRLDQFPDLETFTAALAQEQAERIVTERLGAERAAFYAQQQQAQQQAQAQQSQQRFVAELESRIAKAEKKFPDFRDAIQSPDLPGIIGTPAFGAIWESNIGAEVMYHIAKNPEKAHQIMALSPVGQVREIARIEAAIEAGRTVSSAPPPTESVGGGKGTATKDPGDMNIDEFFKWRRKSIAQKRS